MHTTLGQLISNLFEKFQTVYGDDRLATVATHKTVTELLARSSRSRARRSA
jgi:hypothetical protein